MDVSPWAVDLKLAAAVRDRLEGLIRNGNTPQKLVPRARIALLSDGTRLNGAIAREVGVALPTVHRGQRPVQEQGVGGLLRDKTRPSRLPALAPEVVERVVEMTLHGPPGEATHWSSRTMAAARGVSGTSVRRIWRAHGPKPHRVRTFKLSRDPKFIEKVQNVVGLYMDPPQHALVLSVDGKSQIQALERTQPGLPLAKGQPATARRRCSRRSTCWTVRCWDDARRGTAIRSSSAFSMPSRPGCRSARWCTSFSTTMPPTSTRRFWPG